MHINGKETRFRFVKPEDNLSKPKPMPTRLLQAGEVPPLNRATGYNAYSHSQSKTTVKLTCVMHCFSPTETYMYDLQLSFQLVLSM